MCVTLGALQVEEDTCQMPALQQGREHLMGCITLASQRCVSVTSIHIPITHKLVTTGRHS